jgi:hypothetical protein
MVQRTNKVHQNLTIHFERGIDSFTERRTLSMSMQNLPNYRCCTYMYALKKHIMYNQEYIL